ncbi:MAG: hypothetical protein KDB88_11395 [Flavobacteriales bacterium]|nr:hypothetical protein [Flavobacteriales bacterium]
MKRFILVPALCALFTLNSAGQSFQGGDNNVGLGLGIGGFYAVASSYTAVSPVLSLQYDRGTDIPVGPGVLGIGGYFAFKQLRYFSENPTFTYDQRWTYIMFGVRGTYHWNSWHGNDRLDTYAGVGLGYNVVSYKDRSVYDDNVSRSVYGLSSAAGSSPRGSLFAGVRYYFTESIGVYAEAGMDVAFLTGGVTFQF